MCAVLLQNIDNDICLVLSSQKLPHHRADDTSSVSAAAMKSHYDDDDKIV